MLLIAVYGLLLLCSARVGQSIDSVPSLGPNDTAYVEIWEHFTGMNIVEPITELRIESSHPEIFEVFTPFKEEFSKSKGQVLYNLSSVLEVSEDNYLSVVSQQVEEVTRYKSYNVFLSVVYSKKEEGFVNSGISSGEIIDPEWDNPRTTVRCDQLIRTSGYSLNVLCQVSSIDDPDEPNPDNETKAYNVSTYLMGVYTTLKPVLNSKYLLWSEPRDSAYEMRFSIAGLGANGSTVLYSVKRNTTDNVMQPTINLMLVVSGGSNDDIIRIVGENVDDEYSKKFDGILACHVHAIQTQAHKLKHNVLFMLTRNAADPGLVIVMSNLTVNNISGKFFSDTDILKVVPLYMESSKLSDTGVIHAEFLTTEGNEIANLTVVFAESVVVCEFDMVNQQISSTYCRRYSLGQFRFHTVNILRWSTARTLAILGQSKDTDLLSVLVFTDYQEVYQQVYVRKLKQPGPVSYMAAVQDQLIPIDFVWCIGSKGAENDYFMMVEAPRLLINISKLILHEDEKGLHSMMVKGNVTRSVKDSFKMVYSKAVYISLAPVDYSNVNLALNYSVYEGTKSTTRLPGHAFACNSPAFKVDNDNVRVEYQVELSVRNALKNTTLACTHMSLGQNYFAIYCYKKLTVVACGSDSKRKVRCIMLFKNNTGGELLAGVIKGGFIYLFTRSLVEFNEAFLVAYSIDGQLVKHIKLSGYRAEQATFKIHQGNILLHVVAVNTNVDTEDLPSVFSVEFDDYKNMPRMLTIMTSFEQNWNPLKLSWVAGHKRVLNALMDIEDGHSTYLLTFDIDEFELTKSSSYIKPVLAINLKEIMHDLDTEDPSQIDICTLEKTPVLIDNRNHQMYGFEGDSSQYSVYKLLFKEYGFRVIVEYFCLSEVGLLQVIARTHQGEYYLINYRGSTLNKPNQQVHSILKLQHPDPTSVISYRELTEEDSVYCIVTFAGNKNSAFRINLDSPVLQIDMSRKRDVEDIRVGATIKPFKNDSTARTFSIGISVVPFDCSFGVRLLKSQLDPYDRPNKTPSLDLDSILNVTGILANVELLGSPDGVVEVQGRIHPLLGIEKIEEEVEQYYTMGPHAVYWTKDTLKIQERGKNVLNYSLKGMKVDRICIPRGNQAKGMPIVVVSLNDGSETGLYYVAYYDNSLMAGPMWIAHPPFRVSLVLDVFEANMVGYSRGNFTVMLVGFMYGSQTLYSVEFTFPGSDPEPGEDKVKTKIRALTEVWDQITSIELVSLNLEARASKTMVVIMMAFSTNALYTYNFNMDLDLIFKPTVHRFPRELGASPKHLILECVSYNYQQQHYYGIECMLTTQGVSDYLLVFSVFDTPSTYSRSITYTILREFRNLKEFRPVYTSLSRDWACTLNINDKIIDYSASSRSTGGTKLTEQSISELYTSEGFLGKQSNMEDGTRYQVQDVPGLGSALHENIAIVVYNLKKADKMKIVQPFAVLTPFWLQSLDSSKLQSIFFDLDEIGPDDTQLVVNAKFETRSIIKRFRLQDMSLEVRNPGRVHLRKTKIVLTGIDSRVVIPLSDIFKRNWTRLIVVWTLFVLFGVSLFLIGAYFIVTRSQAWKSATKNEDLDESQDLTVQANMSLLPDKDNN